MMLNLKIIKKVQYLGRLNYGVLEITSVFLQLYSDR